MRLLRPRNGTANLVIPTVSKPGALNGPQQNGGGSDAQFHQLTAAEPPPPLLGNPRLAAIGEKRIEEGGCIARPLRVTRVDIDNRRPLEMIAIRRRRLAAIVVD